ncbi:MAG: sigma-54 dependent transcriptional regulator [Nitrospirota bacterium]|jgi:nitrogen regulation protein NR(I)
MARILVVDDDAAICFALGEYLRGEGHRPAVAASGRQALEQLSEEPFEMVFLDIQMPGMNGLDALTEIGRRWPGLPVVIITAQGGMQTTVRAMQLGAYDYVTKPIDLDRIGELLEHLRRSRAEQARPTSLPEVGEAAHEPHSLLGSSPVMQELFKHIGLLTTNDLTVLLQGETGVGKERVGRAIHYNSPREVHPFVAVNCAAVPEALLESELFGHERGAFTGASQIQIGKFEAAGAGTILLDEVGDLPLGLQAKLLRVLQEREFSRVGSSRALPLRARVIAASNRDLAESVRTGEFRKDLYYRLHVASIIIPPLRDRPEDIPELVAHFLQEAARRLSVPPPTLAEEALERLVAYPWPGNVRELENLIHRTCAFARHPVLSWDDVAPHLEASQALSQPERDAGDTWQDHLRQQVQQHTPGGRDGGESDGLFRRVIAATERTLLEEALARTGGNKVQAARLLGMQRSSFRKKLAQHGL